MAERWKTDVPFILFPDDSSNWRQIQVNTPQRIEIPDTGSANSLLSIEHGLGRIPNKVVIIKSRVAVSGDVSWHTLTSDPDWTNRMIHIRVPIANSRLLLEVS